MKVLAVCSFRSRSTLILLLVSGIVLPFRTVGTPEKNYFSTTGIAGVADQSSVVNMRALATLAERRALAPAEAPPRKVAPLIPVPSMPVPKELASGQALAAQPSQATPSAPPAPSPVPVASFLALDDNNTAIPPDTHGAVGPNHLMVTLNSQVRIQDRTGAVISTVALDSFWSGFCLSHVFDPKVLYDPYGERWIFTAMADPRSADSSLLIGVSQTSDPTGDWNLYRIDADAGDTGWIDYPSVGFNKNWIVVQGNMDPISTNTLANNSQIYVFNKADLYANGAGLHTLFPRNDIGSTQVPATTYDENLATMYLVTTWSGDGILRMFTITGAVGSEVMTDGSFVSTSNPWAPDGGVDLAPQLGSSEGIHVNDHRMQNVVYRNGQLWCTHTIFLPAVTPTRSAIQWWQLSSDGTILQRGRMDDASGTNFYAFPSIAVNKDDDVLIGYSRFSATQYASGNYAFRMASDAANTLRDDTVLKAGEAPYYKTFSGTKNRWGDYSHTVVDPLNDADMWTIQQYAALPYDGEDRWSTWWGKIRPPSTASLPFSEDFESGNLDAYWTVTGTAAPHTMVTASYGPHGGAYHLTMDDAVAGSSFSRNELTLSIDLAGYEDVVLSFWARDFEDEEHGPPAIPFTDGADFDGVAISEDGMLWYEVQGLRSEISGTYTPFTVNLDAAIMGYGLSYNSTFQIRFNQYDNWTLPNDGIALDDITITGNPSTHGTHYVDINNTTPAFPYASWFTAATNIQDAVDAATSNDMVLVADGVYNITSGITVAKDIELWSVNGPEVTIVDGGNVTGCFWLGTNACLLSGFTIRNGRINPFGGTWNWSGGGIYCLDTVPVVSNCVIRENYSFLAGGGMSGGTAYNCTFSSNSIDTGVGSAMADGVAYNCTFSGNTRGGIVDGTAYNCVISSNSSPRNGGGMYGGTAYNCIFSGNSIIGSEGGGMYQGTAYNCIFSSNSASFGGGMSEGAAYNCTFSDNTADEDGGGIYESSATNCIVYHNQATGSGNDTYAVSASFSCASDLLHGLDGNITNAPVFEDRFNGNHQLTAASPCVNAGTNSAASLVLDLDGLPRIVDFVVDMGAYEYQEILDSDGDGMPDGYEVFYFGGKTNAVATADEDTDGQNNGEEYIAGMNPLDAASLFAVTGFETLPGSVHFVITWNSVPGRVYTTLWTTNLMDSFQLLETDIEYPRNSSTDTVHSAEDQCFYEVEVRL